jgi:hypothetical protein
MTSRFLSLIPLFVLGFVACETPIQGHYDFDSRAPFRTYTTYAWITSDPLIPAIAGVAAGGVQPSPILEPHIRAAVERSLASKGYEKVGSPAAADLVVSFSIGAREKIEVSSYPAHSGYRSRGYYGGWRSDVRIYTEGTLAIDFFDAKTKGAVWHGWATKRVTGSRSSEERAKLIDRAVDAILEEFPLRNPPR